MQWTITRKLFLAFIIISLLILVMSALFGRLSFQQGFHAYLAAKETPVVTRIAETLAREYAASNGWAGLAENAARWHQLLRSGSGDFERRRDAGPGPRDGGRGRPPPADFSEPPPRGGPPGRLRPQSRPVDPLRLGARLGLYSLDNVLVAGRAIALEEARLTEVIVAGEVVGQLRLAPGKGLEQALDIEFDQQQGRSLVLIALVLLGLASAASWLVARQFTQPIRLLADGTRAIAGGDYDQPVVTGGQDELGALANDVNALARVLNANRESRRRWLTDINHELRTPVAILQAELQALEDGLRKFDQPAVQSLQSEVDRLGQLIDDLYSLSASDEGSVEYRYAEFDVADLLNELVEANQARLQERGLKLEFDPVARATRLTGDATRVGQLITNLLENAIRYTDAPGRLRIIAGESGDHWELIVEDSAPGVPDGLHERIFERLYRVDRSRNRALGGSGLGLSICTAIVSAHGGTIEAQSSVLGGLKVRVVLPIHPGSAGQELANAS